MTAKEERLKIIGLLENLTEKLSELSDKVNSGSKTMKALQKELNKIKRSVPSEQKTLPILDNPNGLTVQGKRPNLFDPTNFKVKDEDPTLDDSKQAPRTRGEFKKKRIFCGDCNKDVLIHPNLLAGRDPDKPYICPDIKAGHCPNK